MSCDITVEICAYNGRSLLLSCLDALSRVAFDRTRFEVVVVDDGSVDGTAEAVESLQVPFELRLVRQPHAGLATARNTGIRAARGDTVLFLDHDTMAHPNLLAEHWRTHQRHPRAIVSGWVHHVEDLRPRERRIVRLPDLSMSTFWTSNVSVGRTELTAAGLFDEDFREYGWEDLELGARLRALGLARRRNWRAIVDHVKPPATPGGLTSRLARAEASGRSAVIYLRKRPTLRTKMATGLGPARRLLFRMLDRFDGRLTATVLRAPDAPLRGWAFIASELLSGIHYYRSAEQALAPGQVRAAGPTS